MNITDELSNRLEVLGISFSEAIDLDCQEQGYPTPIDWQRRKKNRTTIERIFQGRGHITTLARLVRALGGELTIQWNEVEVIRTEEEGVKLLSFVPFSDVCPAPKPTKCSVDSAA